MKLEIIYKKKKKKPLGVTITLGSNAAGLQTDAVCEPLSDDIIQVAVTWWYLENIYIRTYSIHHPSSTLPEHSFFKH